MALILIFIFLALILLILKPRKRLRNEPPLVPGHLFFGNALQFSKDAVGFLLRNQKIYGDVFTLRLMNQHLTIVMDPQFYDQIGKHKDLSFEGIQQQVNWNVFGFAVHDTKTLLKETGITMRGRHQTASLKSFLRNLEKSTINLKGSMSTGLDKIQLRPLVVSTLFSAIFTSIFGTSNDEIFNPILVHKNFEVFHRYFNFLWLGMPLWLFPEARKALTNLHNMPDSETLLDRKDLSSYLRKAIIHLTSQNQTEAEIRGHNLVYLHVNYNTFRLAYWALYFLIKCNEARTSIMEELKNTLGDVETQDVDLSEELMNRLPHLDSFVQETCRMSSGVFIVRHVANNTSIQLGELSFKLREGDKVAIFPPSIHKDPAIFDKPQEFKHDRFLGRKFQKSGQQLSNPVMSFGILCPGKKYALLQLKIFIIIMLLRFEMKIEGDEVLHFDETFSGHEILPPKGDVNIRLSAKSFQNTVDFNDSTA